MRRKPGSSIEDTLSALDESQRSALDAIRSQREAEAQVAVDLKRAVLTAIEADVPVPVIAETLGVHRSRVYQIRDEALALVS